MGAYCVPNCFLKAVQNLCKTKPKTTRNKNWLGYRPWTTTPRAWWWLLVIAAGSVHAAVGGSTVAGVPIYNN
jgi:hypothetical protein